MVELAARIASSAQVYRSFVEAAMVPNGAMDHVGLFAYRTAALESEVVRPVVLLLLDPNEPPIPVAQVRKALMSLESWLVRRMLVRATSKSYSQVMAELVREIRRGERAEAGDTVEGFFRHQTGASRYWPDDDEVRGELATARIYRRLSRSRLRMVLEGAEDHRRGFVPGKGFESGKRERRFRGVVKRCDGVIAGNRFLADEAAKFNRNVVVIPTCVNPESYPPAKHDRPRPSNGTKE